MIYVREGQPIPFDYWALETVEVPAIRREDVAKITRSSIDVTMHYSTRRDFVLCPPEIHMKDGTVVEVPYGLVGDALAGGGRFVIAYPNPVYDEPLTLEEFERREEARLEREAEDWAMEWN